MSYQLVTIVRLWTVRAPWGIVAFVCDEPSTRLRLTVGHKECMNERERYTESEFDATVSVSRSGKLTLRLEYDYTFHALRYNGTERKDCSHCSNTALWEPRLREWLVGWARSRSDEFVLIRALSYHNRYARLREEHRDIDPSSVATHVEQMRRSAIRALPATRWLLQESGRSRVREFAMQYVPLVGRPRHTITAADLHL